MKLSALTTKVGSGATPRGGSAAYKSQGIPLIRSMNVHFDGVRDEGLAFIDEVQARALDAVTVHGGDVLLNITGASIGRVAVAPERLAGARVNQHVCIIRATEPLDAYFLKLFLNAPSQQRLIMEEEAGATRQALTKEKILSFDIPLPPLNEQRRIVAKLDALQERSRRARASLDAVPALLDKLRQSILAAAFRGDLTRDFREQHKDLEPASKLLQRIRTERRKKWEEAELAKLKAKGKAPTDDKWKAKYKEPDPVDPTGLPTLPDGWCWAKAEEVCDLITKGTTPSADKLTHVGDVPFLKVYNLTFNGTVDFSVDPTFVAAETHHGFLARSRVFPGDVLMNIVGPPLGKVGIVPDLFPEWNMNQAIAVFRSITGLHREFLANYLLSAQSVQRAVREGKATAGQLNLTLEICRDLPLPLCSEMEQRQIILALSTAMRSCQAVSMDAETASERLSSLDRAILAKAFRGELVPQDPRDEPADELLARVRADQAAPSTPRGRKRAAEAALHD